MICGNCGQLLEDGSKFCTNCGKKQPWIDPSKPAKASVNPNIPGANDFSGEDEHTIQVPLPDDGLNQGDNRNGPNLKWDPDTAFPPDPDYAWNPDLKPKREPAPQPTPDSRPQPQPWDAPQPDPRPTPAWNPDPNPQPAPAPGKNLFGAIPKWTPKADPAPIEETPEDDVFWGEDIQPQSGNDGFPEPEEIAQPVNDEPQVEEELSNNWDNNLWEKEVQDQSAGDELQLEEEQLNTWDNNLWEVEVQDQSADDEPQIEEEQPHAWDNLLWEEDGQNQSAGDESQPEEEQPNITNDGPVDVVPDSFSPVDTISDPKTEPIWPEDLPPQTDPWSTPQPDPHPTPGLGPNPDPVTQPDPKPQPWGSPQPDSQPVQDPQPTPWGSPQPDPQPVQDPQPTPWGSPQPNPQPVQDPQPTPWGTPQPGPQPVPNPQPQPQPQPQSKGSQVQSSLSVFTNTLFISTPEPVFTAPAPAGGYRFLSDVHFGKEQKGRFEGNQVSDREFMDCLNSKLNEKKSAARAQFMPVVWDDEQTAEKEIVIKLPPKGNNNTCAVISYRQNEQNTFLYQRIHPEASNIPVKEPEKPEKFFSANGFLAGAIGFIIFILGISYSNAYSSIAQFGGSSSTSFGGVMTILCGIALIAYGIFVDYRNNQWAGIYNAWKAAKQARDNWFERNVTFLSRQIEIGYPVYETILDSIDEACLECFGQEPERS